MEHQVSGTAVGRWRRQRKIAHRSVAFIALGAGASILRGVGRAISHISESGGVDGLVILGFDRLLLHVVVALGIPVMPTVNEDYLKLVLPYVYVNST